MKKGKTFAKRMVCKALGKANWEDVDVVDKSEIIYHLKKMITVII